MSAVSADPEADYYQTVEEYFVSRRGDPLILSNADWTLVRKWRLAGLPLRVVLRGIRDALDAHAHRLEPRAQGREPRVLRGRGGRGGRALAARARARERAGAGRRPALARLRRTTCDGRASSGRGRGRSRTRSRASSRSGPKAARSASDGWLSEREGRLVEALGEDKGQDGVALREAEVDAGLERWRARMPARVVEPLRRESRARRLLEAHGLPRLSLFHLEAGGAA